jgi:hypothetical protein
MFVSRPSPSIMTRSAPLTLATSEGTSSNVCELMPSGTNPVKSILFPPMFLIMLVKGETDVTTFNFRVAEVSVVFAGVKLSFLAVDGDEFKLVCSVTLLPSVGSDIAESNATFGDSVHLAIENVDVAAQLVTIEVNSITTASLRIILIWETKKY